MAGIANQQQHGPLPLPPAAPQLATKTNSAASKSRGQQRRQQTKGTGTRGNKPNVTHLNHHRPGTNAAMNETDAGHSAHKPPHKPYRRKKKMNKRQADSPRSSKHNDKRSQPSTFYFECCQCNPQPDPVSHRVSSGTTQGSSNKIKGHICPCGHEACDACKITGGRTQGERVPVMEGGTWRHGKHGAETWGPIGRVGGQLMAW